MAKKRANGEGSIRKVFLPRETVELLVKEHRKHPSSHTASRGG